MTKTPVSDQVPVGSVTTSAEQVRMIAIDDLFVSPDNPRKTFDRKELEGMAATIRQGGIRVPLLVRPQALSFEIICGQRRHAAAKLAELQELPCIVREMTDDEAREAAVIDNAQRADVPALEEADAFGALKEILGTAEAVAARVGKELSHVTRRLKLLDLGMYQMDALRERLITVDHALLLAKLGVYEQDRALKWALDTNAGAKTTLDELIRKSIGYLNDDGRYREWEPESVVRLREHIEQSVGRKLNNAPWNLDDAMLAPDAGACTNCPSNTKANLALFGDLDIDEATCADGACFQAKTSAYVEIQLHAAKAVDKNAVRISWKQTSTSPHAVAKTDEKFLAQTFKDGQWVKAKKGSCGFLHTGVTVDFPQDRGYMGSSEDKKKKPGETFLVCVAMGCKVHTKSYEKRASSSGSNASEQEREKREAERREAFVKAEAPVRRALYDSILEKIKPETIKRNALPRMNAEDAICLGDGFLSDDWQAKRKHVEELIASVKDAELDRLLFHMTFGLNLSIHVYQMSAKDKGRGELRELAKVVGVDAAAIERKFDAAAKKSEPKTPKKAVKKPAAKKRCLTPEARKRIVAATKKRWATNKKGGAA